MKRSTIWIAASLLALLALPAVAQINDTYVIPAAINASGAYGSRWMTQLSIFNPQTYPLTVSITYLPQGGGKTFERLVTVQPNSTAYADNSLLEIFQFAGAVGAYVVATFPEDNPTVPNNMIDRSFLVNTNTVNVQPDGGTYGQTIAGTFTGLQDFATEGVSAIAHGIRDDNQYGWRTNFGAVNLGSTDVILRITVYDRAGNALVTKRPYTVPAEGQMQSRLPVEIADGRVGTIEFFVDDPANKAVVFPYASTLDRWTGDPEYQNPALLASAKYLYGKTATAVAAMPLGKRITTEDARAIRANATPLGVIELQSK